MKARTFFHALLATLAAAMGITTVEAGSIPIAISGFNQDMVVEAGAVNDPVTHYEGAVTATMDAGIAKKDNTWYEQGLAGSGGGGLPTGGLFTSLSDPSTQFQLAAYTGNNALLLDAANTSGTLTLLTPGHFSSLSFLTSSGSVFQSAPTLGLTIHFADGSSALSGLGIVSPDWFDHSPTALNASGRVGVDTGNFDHVGTSDPRMYQETVQLPSNAWGHPISSIDITWTSNGSDNSHTGIFALSGVSVPEPSSVAMLGSGVLGLALTLRRRHARGR
jgi:hypothetical protein